MLDENVTFATAFDLEMGARGRDSFECLVCGSVFRLNPAAEAWTLRSWPDTDDVAMYCPLPKEKGDGARFLVYRVSSGVSWLPVEDAPSWMKADGERE
jgi:hypothetical protein